MSLVLSKSQVFIYQNLTSLRKQIFLFYPTLALSMKVRNYFPLFFYLIQSIHQALKLTIVVTALKYLVLMMVREES